MNDDGVYFLLVSALAMLFWAGRGPLALDRRRSGDLGWVMAAGTLYALSYLHHGFGFTGSVNGSGVFYSVLLSAIAIAGLKASNVEERAGAGGQRGFKLVLGLPLALSLLLVLTGQEVAVGYLANVALLGFCIYAMHAGLLRSDKRLINHAVAVVGLLMVTRFIDYFGSLLTSGSAFIVMGLLFLGIAYALDRGRRRLLEQVMAGGVA